MAHDLTGKVIVITGGSSGIGAAAAKALRARGAEVVITGRSDETKRLADAIGAEAVLTDFKKLDSVAALAKHLLAEHPRIDVLMNNVGGIMDERHLTSDGFEATFQVNHLGGFLLTSLLQDRLNASGATVVNTSSFGNTMGHVDLGDLQNERSYSALRAYGTAKLMNILHANEVQRRYGDKVSAASFHPGVVATGFAREGNWYTRLFYNSPLGKLFMISPERGADTMLWLATGRPGADWTPGEYYDKRKPGQRNAQARDTELARGLWEASEKLLAPWLAAAPKP